MAVNLPLTLMED